MEIQKLQSFHTLRKPTLDKYVNHTFFETGTYLGDSVKLALECGFEKIISVELMEELQNQNRNKFKKELESGKVDLITGDTLLMIDSIIEGIEERATFWLDAHQDLGPAGEKPCPLYEEIEAIGKSKIKSHTIMIDDMRCLDGRFPWSVGINQEGIIARLKAINPEYKISYEDGMVRNDIMVAYID